MGRVGLMVLLAVGVFADISGFVLVAGSGSPGTPIANARVHLEADESVVAISAADGSYNLAVNPVGPVMVTAALAYDPLNPANYTIAGTFAMNGDMGVEIRLDELPGDVVSIMPSASTDCVNCHPDQYFSWFSSAHGGAGTDVWVRDLYSGDGTAGGAAGYVFRDLHDPGDTGFCATCHTPLADILDPGNVYFDEVTSSTALEGVNCVACHKMAHVNADVNALHHLGNATYRFPDGPAPTWQYVWGPLDDVTFTSMQASHQPQYAESIYCASCHQYQNPFNGAPGQSTYEEWLASPFAVAGPGYQTCQDCHMPQLPAGQICSVGAPPTRPSERNRGHGFASASQASLSASIDMTAAISDLSGVLSVSVDVANIGAGHDFPTGVSIRNAMLIVEAFYAGTPLDQLSGPVVPAWANDDVPGIQPGDYGNMAGLGFAKVLQGRINGQGPVVSPVLFIDAESVLSDTSIPAGASATAAVTFRVPGFAVAGETIDVRARLIYRRAWRALAVTKNWTVTPQGGDIEIEVERQDIQHVLANDGFQPQVPTLSWQGRLFLVIGLMVAVAWVRTRYSH